MIWALAGALTTGLSLGLLGSGGSILTVPVLTYLVGQDEKIAIAGSLAIVGTISLVTGIPYARAQLVDFRSVTFFGLPGMAGAFLGAILSSFVPGVVQLGVFALLMMAAAVFMFRSVPMKPEVEACDPTVFRLGVQGLSVGVVTGFVGVGGGFMIVPALVLLGGLSMRRAIGTSLFIISLNSLTGFLKHLDILHALGEQLDWRVIGVFSVLGVVGGFVGKAVSVRIPQHRIRRGFAVFLVAISLFIIAKSVPEIVAH